MKLLGRRKRRRTLLFKPRFPFEIAEVIPGGEAERVGLRSGDFLYMLNNDTLIYFDAFVSGFKKNRNSTVAIGVLRGEEMLDFEVNLDSLGHIRVYANRASLKTEIYTYSFFAAIPAGVRKARKTVVDYLQQLKLIFKPETKAYQSVGGLITMGSIFPGMWNWHAFWSLTALLSVVLGVMNILPIPALDGGHVVLLIYEMITGEKAE